MNKRLKALFSGVWGCGGVAVGVEVTDAAEEVPMDNLVEVDTAEVVEEEAGTAVVGFKGQAEAAVGWVSG